MSKPGLGKNLGDLMNGDPVAGRESVVGASAGSDRPMGRGLTTLISAPRTGAAGDLPAQKRQRALPPWFFFAADLLLLGFVVGITFDAPRPFDPGTILFCAVSVGLGAVLAIIGLLQLTD